MFDKVRITGLHKSAKVFSYGTIHRLLRKRGATPDDFLRVEIELRDDRRSKFKSYELTLVEKGYGRTRQD